MQVIEIKSIKQIGEDLKKSKRQLEAIVNLCNIPPLTQAEDLQKNILTVEKIIEIIPSETKLKEMLESHEAQSSERRYKALEHYQGDYELLQKINLQEKELKSETEKMYYLVAELNLPKIQSKSRQMQSQGKIKLKSLEVLNNQNNRSTKFERNMISPHFFESLKEEEDKDPIALSNENICLQENEILLSVSYYESVNGQKQSEFLCYGEQTLLDLAKQFYCLVVKLHNQLSNHIHESYFLIEHNFYYNGLSVRKKIDQITTFVTNKRTEDYSTHITSAPQKLEMAKTQIKNLRLVFGRPYLFRHLDGCDHMIIFKDMKLYQNSSKIDLSLKARYPLVVFENKMKRRKCEACKNKFSSIVSLADQLKQGKTLYLCDVCHHNLHQNSNSKNNIFVKYIHD